jgi:hypothetical protein
MTVCFLDSESRSILTYSKMERAAFGPVHKCQRLADRRSVYERDAFKSKNVWADIKTGGYTPTSLPAKGVWSADDKTLW